MTRRARREGPADAGLSFVEVLVSVVILGLAGVAVLGAAAASARGSALQRNHANAQSVTAAAADVVMGITPVTCNVAAATYQAGARARVDALALGGGWTGATVTVGVVREWNTALRRFDTGCVTTNPELVTPQLVPLTITSPDGRTTKQVEVVTAAIPDRVPIGNPWVFGEAPFALVSFGSVRLADQFHVWGGAAVGGNISFVGNNAELGKNTPGIYVAGTDGAPSSLLVEGRIDFASSSGRLKVMSGWVHVGDMSNAQYGYESSHLVLRASAAAGPRVEFDFQTAQAGRPETLNQGGLYDFVAAKHVFTSESLALAQLPGQCADATSAKLVDQWGVAATSGNAWWQITPGRVNVLTTTMSQLGPYGSININGPRANRDTPLIVNVMDPGAVTFDKGNITQNMDQHTIWNFPNATSINVSGLVSGTLLAPSAAVTLNAEIRGALIADSVAGGYAIKWDQARPDIRDIACDRGV